MRDELVQVHRRDEVLEGRVGAGAVQVDLEVRVPHVPEFVGGPNGQVHALRGRNRPGLEDAELAAAHVLGAGPRAGGRHPVRHHRRPGGDVDAGGDDFGHGRLTATDVAAAGELREGVGHRLHCLRLAIDGAQRPGHVVHQVHDPRHAHVLQRRHKAQSAEADQVPQVGHVRLELLNHVGQDVDVRRLEVARLVVPNPLDQRLGLPVEVLSRRCPPSSAGAGRRRRRARPCRGAGRPARTPRARPAAGRPRPACTPSRTRRGRRAGTGC